MRWRRESICLPGHQPRHRQYGQPRLAHGEPRRFEEAIGCYQQALAILRETSDRHGEGKTLTDLSNAYEELRQQDRAAAYWRDPAAAMRDTGDREQAAPGPAGRELPVPAPLVATERHYLTSTTARQASRSPGCSAGRPGGAGLLCPGRRPGPDRCCGWADDAKMRIPRRGRVPGVSWLHRIPVQRPAVTSRSRAPITAAVRLTLAVQHQ
jgi:hypothetical protein